MAFDVSSVIGIDSTLKKIFEKVKKIAPHNMNCLIIGESGTGKELIARMIHQLSPRANRAFIAVNCTAITAELFESELFGYEKGAFTGAAGQKPGLIERANGGTLFLDEIGDMPMNLQPKLLRVLNDKCLRRVGGTVDDPVDFRLISATNVDMEAAISDKRFREDILYRIGAFKLELPPLRARMDDLEQLVSFFIDKHAKALQMQPVPVAEDAMRYLRKLEWKGNIRQLESTISAAMILAGEDPEINLEIIQEATLDNNEYTYETAVQQIADIIIRGKKDNKEIENDIIRKIIHVFNDDVPLTAEKTGFSRAKLYRVMRSFEENTEKTIPPLRLYTA